MGLDLTSNLNKLFTKGLNSTSGLNASQRVGQTSKTQEDGAASAVGAQLAQRFGAALTQPQDFNPNQKLAGVEGGQGSSSVNGQFQLPTPTRFGGVSSPSDVQGFDISKPTAPTGDGFYGSSNFAGRNSYDAAKAIPNGRQLQVFA